MRSQRCESNSCVEVTRVGSDAIAFRDSKDPDGPILRFSRGDWNAFLRRVEGGDFQSA